VISVAKKYQNRGLPLTDLIGEGNVGLLTAARKFDPDQGVKFISYAVCGSARLSSPRSPAGPDGARAAEPDRDLPASCALPSISGRRCVESRRRKRSPTRTKLSLESCSRSPR